MKTPEQQALFEIVMAIGNGMELRSMLQSSLMVMLRSLGCRLAVVARGQGDDLQLVHAIPGHLCQSESMQQLCRDLAQHPPAAGGVHVRTVSGDTRMAFSLPGYGLLLLGRGGPPLSPPILGNLGLIANKLAQACLACEQAAAVQEAQEHAQLLLDSTAEGIFGLDAQGNCTFANAAFLRMTGVERAQDIVGQPVHDWLHCAADTAGATDIDDCPCCQSMGSAQPAHADDQFFRRRDGRRFPVEYWSRPITREGQRHGAVITCFDISSRRQAEQALQISEARLHTLIETIPDLVWLKDIHGVYLACNPMLAHFFGAPQQDIIGRTDYDFVDASQAESFREQDRRAILAGKPCTNEEWMYCASDGRRVLLETIKAPTLDASGKVIGVLGVARDITERRAAEDQIRNLAFYDPLTQLPNRRLLLDRLHHALMASARSGRDGALLFIDLDNFKSLNDTLGHDQGDHLLQQVSQRLLRSIREGDTAARFGGDEFVIMLENLSDSAVEAATQAEVIGEKILAQLNEPYQLGSHVHHSTPSIGITLFSGSGGSVDELLKRADLAMYHAKAAGRNALRFFDPQMQALISARLAMENDMRDGLRQGRFVLFYQAQVEDGGHVCGAEVLVHWQHPRRGLLPPSAFIGTAEESGLILQLGRQVLRRACEQLALWAKDPDLAHLYLAVNISAAQLRQPDFVGMVVEELCTAGANPARLKLELTESLLLDDVEGIIRKMLELKRQGIGLALDDFGTGYSSLTYLKRLPLDQLKIDQSFVRDVLQDSHDAAFARTIIALAQWLGLSVIAEGVETAEQQHFLASQGCFVYQGYLYGRPVPLEEFEKTFRDVQNRPRAQAHHSRRPFKVWSGF